MEYLIEAAEQYQDYRPFDFGDTSTSYSAAKTYRRTNTVLGHRRMARSRGTKRKYITSSYRKGQPKRGSRYKIPARGRGFLRASGYYGASSTELKFFDLEINDTAIGVTGSLFDSINKVKQGTGEEERTGRKMTIKKINWHYNIVLPKLDGGSSANLGTTVRVILYLDKQANGATATAADILEDNDVAVNYQSYNKLSNKNRFRILMDRSHDINYLTLASTSVGNFDQAPVSQSYSLYKECNIPVEFSDTTGAMAEIRSNNVGVLLVAENPIANFDSKIRIRFLEG